MGPLLEIAAGSLGSALAAQAGGADRIELCADLAAGGLTPSFGTLALARERLRIPLYVLIRPRVGDFVYDADEFAIMRRDIETCVRLGCDGVVIGALDADANVDMPGCRELVAAAGSLGVTFHRAFDAARDQVRALEDVIGLGCERMLTSGGHANVVQGAEVIAGLVAQSAGRIRVMAGAGITPDNLVELAGRTRADEFHASAKALRPSSMRWHGRSLPGLATDREESDRAIVHALKQALQRLA